MNLEQQDMLVLVVLSQEEWVFLFVLVYIVRFCLSLVMIGVVLFL